MNDEKGMLWCEENGVDCAWMRDGKCKAPRCNINDIDYIEKSKRQEARRAELHARQLAKKKAEKGKTERELIEEEIRFLRRHVQNCYTRGWTRLGDRESEYLARLERKLARK